MAPTSSSSTSLARDSGGSGTVSGQLTELSAMMRYPISVGLVVSVLAGQRILVAVENPARLGREIHARRTEDVDQQIDPGTRGLRGVDRRRRNYYDGRRLAGL